LKTLLFVAAGGAFGSAARYSVGMWTRTAGNFPWGTWLVNVTGSLALGFIAGYLASNSELDPAVRTGLTVGVLGGFTTFSTWTVETVEMLGNGELGLALMNVLGAVVVGLLAAVVGLTLGRATGA
jgi:CrcB protein